MTQPHSSIEVFGDAGVVLHDQLLAAGRRAEPWVVDALRVAAQLYPTTWLSSPLSAVDKAIARANRGKKVDVAAPTAEESAESFADSEDSTTP